MLKITQCRVQISGVARYPVTFYLHGLDAQITELGVRIGPRTRFCLLMGEGILETI